MPLIVYSHRLHLLHVGDVALRLAVLLGALLQPQRKEGADLNFL